ncbi:MAG: VC0807 family protein [bacterium]
MAQAPEAKPTVAKKNHKQENLLLSLAFNILIPTIILTKFSSEEYLGVKQGLVIALLFPLTYGLREFIRDRKVNLFSALGFISVLLTGGISLMELSPFYIAVKEAAIPAIFGVATVVSLYTPYPLVRTLIYNDRLLDTGRIANELERRDSTRDFEQLLVRSSWILASSFFLSSVLNYGLATYLLTGYQSGTSEFNEQLGKMTALSFPVIAVPAMIVMIGSMLYLFRGIKRLTGLHLEELVHHHKTEEK